MEEAVEIVTRNSYTTNNVWIGNWYPPSISVSILSPWWNSNFTPSEPSNAFHVRSPRQHCRKQMAMGRRHSFRFWQYHRFQWIRTTRWISVAVQWTGHQFHRQFCGHWSHTKQWMGRQVECTATILSTVYRVLWESLCFSYILPFDIQETLVQLPLSLRFLQRSNWTIYCNQWISGLCCCATRMWGDIRNLIGVDPFHLGYARSMYLTFS